MGSVRKENGFSNNDSLTSIPVPYMLHLQPVTVPATASDAPTSEVLNSEDTDTGYRKIILAGRLPAQQNATVNLDLSSRSVSAFNSWVEFHNGVAAGLRLSPFQEKMLRTWIQYNRPSEPNFTHAGLLLAFGLHEHLRVLTMTDAYRYLSQEHDITTLGLLLGLAASHRGTMHSAISKMLYFHVPSRHPSSTPELELPTLLQGEIGRRSGGDNVLEREGYAVAAGTALGFVALGRGSDAFGFMDTFPDRLFEYIGSKEVYHILVQEQLSG